MRATSSIMACSNLNILNERNTPVRAYIQVPVGDNRTPQLRKNHPKLTRGGDWVAVTSWKACGIYTPLGFFNFEWIRRLKVYGQRDSYCVPKLTDFRQRYLRLVQYTIPTIIAQGKKIIDRMRKSAKALVYVNFIKKPKEKIIKHPAVVAFTSLVKAAADNLEKKIKQNETQHAIKENKLPDIKTEEGPTPPTIKSLITPNASRPLITDASIMFTGLFRGLNPRMAQYHRMLVETQDKIYDQHQREEFLRRVTNIDYWLVEHEDKLAKICRITETPYGDIEKQLVKIKAEIEELGRVNKYPLSTDPYDKPRKFRELTEHEKIHRQRNPDLCSSSSDEEQYTRQTPKLTRVFADARDREYHREQAKLPPILRERKDYLTFDDVRAGRDKELFRRARK